MRLLILISLLSLGICIWAIILGFFFDNDIITGVVIITSAIFGFTVVPAIRTYRLHETQKQRQIL